MKKLFTLVPVVALLPLAGGNFSIFFPKPISGVFIVLAVLFFMKQKSCRA